MFDLFVFSCFVFAKSSKKEKDILFSEVVIADFSHGRYDNHCQFKLPDSDKIQDSPPILCVI